jgi:hypothetical protein
MFQCPSGRAVINEDDLGMYEDKGFKLVSAEKPATPATPAAKPATPATPAAKPATPVAK